MKELSIRKCPITGVDLITHPDWTKAVFTPSYNTTYIIIENNILLCESIGFVNLEGIKKSLNLSSKIIKENFDNKPFVYVEDFSKVTSITVEARKYYIKYLNHIYDYCQ